MFQCVLGSLIPFLNSLFIVLLLLDTNHLTQIPNLVMLVFSSITIILAVFKFHFHAFHFTPLRVFYKHNILAQNHCLLNFAVVLLATVLLCVLSEQSFVPLIPLALMALYTLLLRPHLELKNNLRSVFNYIAMSALVGFKCYARTLSARTLSNENTFFLILSAVTLCLLAVIVSFAFHVLHLRSLKRQSETLKEENKMCLEVLNNLAKTDVQQKILFTKNVFFSDVVSPKHSLLSASKFFLREAQRQSDFGDLQNTKLSEVKELNEKAFDFDSLNWKQNDYLCSQNKNDDFVCIPCDEKVGSDEGYSRNDLQDEEVDPETAEKKLKLKTTE